MTKDELIEIVEDGRRVRGLKPFNCSKECCPDFVERLYREAFKIGFDTAKIDNRYTSILDGRVQTPLKKLLFELN